MTLTFSQAMRIEACPASEVLPHTRQAEGSKYAAYGAAIHAYLRDVNLLGAEVALEKVPEKFRDACAAIPLDKLPMVDPAKFIPEVAFAFDPDSGVGKELSRGSDSRDYSGVPPGWWAGTADLVGVTDTHVIVWDIKTGWAALADPGEHLQLLGYAIAAAQTWGKSQAWVGFIRIPEGGEPRFSFAELEPWDLDEAGQRFHALAKQVEALKAVTKQESYDEEDFPLVEGEHCKFCPAFSRCPAKRFLLNEAVAATMNIEAPLASGNLAAIAPQLTDLNFPAVLRRWELTKKLLDVVGEQLEAYAGERDIPLGDGMVYGRVARSVESVDLVKGLTVLAAKYGPDMARDAVEEKKTLPVGKLGKALRKWIATHNEGKPKAEKLAVGVAEDDMYAALRAARATNPGVSYSYRRHKSKPLLPGEQPEIKQIAPKPMREIGEEG